MSDENKANYGKIGFFVILCSVLIAGTLVYLGGFRGNQHELLVETYFPQDVSGLSKGSAVNFRGVKVGSVKRISFIVCEYDDVDENDAQKIWVELAIDSRLFRLKEGASAEEVLKALVGRGLHATVSASGVTGLSRIELNFPKTKIADAPISWNPRYICIPPQASILESAADSLTMILDSINRMDFASTWSNVVSLVGSADSAVGSVDTILSTQQGNVSEILDNLREASASLRDFAAEIKSNPSLLLRSNDPAALEETRRR